MTATRDIKARAKQLLHGELLIGAVAVAVTLTAAAIISLCVEMAAFAMDAVEGTALYLSLSALAALLSLLTVSPLIFGIRRRCILTAVSNFVPLFDIFHLFSKPREYFKFVLLKGWIYLRAALWGLGFYLLGSAGLWLLDSDSILLQGGIKVLLSFSSVSFFVIGGLLSAWSLVRSYLCEYFFALAPDCKRSEIIRESAHLMKGKTVNLLDLFLRFIPWFLLVFTGIAIPFVAAYYEMSAAVFAQEVIYGGEQK